MNALSKIFNNSPAREKPLLFLIDSIQLFCLGLLVVLLRIEESSGLVQSVWILGGGMLIANLINKNYFVYVFILTGITLVYYAFSWFSGTLFIVLLVIGVWWLSLNISILWKVLGFVAGLIFLAFLRMGYIYMPRFYIVIPFVSVLFMFRGISFLYYLKNFKLKGSVEHRIAYFMMLPNLIFLLFPIIDFKEFVQNYLVKPIEATRQKAIRYMLRAIIHLLLYRFIYHYLYIDETQVSNASTLMQYIVTAYLLILRLSGTLHFSMAIICWFGYDLSPVFNYFFLGRSFTDLWRRINTNWRNFMQKVFFYPLYFKIRKSVGNYALPLATIVMFVFSWFFHNYQMFWVRGTVMFTAVDAVFWIALGLMITVNVTYLEYIARKNIRKKERSPLVKYSFNALAIMGCFLFMSTLWSLWSSSGFSEWLNIFSFAKVYSSSELILLLVLFIVVFVLLVTGHFLYYGTSLKQWIESDYNQTRSWTWVVLVAASVSVLLLGQKTDVAEWKNVLFNRLDKIQTNKQERGYYKNVLDGNNTDAWEVSLYKPFRASDVQLIAVQTNDLYLKVFKPNSSMEWNNANYSINSFGIRDKEYASTKKSGYHRIITLGGSYEFGSGVNDNQVFLELVEMDLNKQGFKNEILNFSSGGYHLIQQVKQTKEKIFKYHPDEVYLFAHSKDKQRLTGFFADLIQSGIPLEFEFLKEIKRKAGVKQYMSEKEILKRLSPFGEEIMEWAYTEIYNECDLQQVRPVLVFLPATKDTDFEKERDKVLSLTQQLGYTTLDLSAVYSQAGYSKDPIDELVLSKDDPHPNAKGHQIIADFMVEQLIKNNLIFKPAKNQ